MRKIDFRKLKRGDIILTTSVEKESSIIRAFTNSDISHAMLYVSDGSVMDSTGEGVQARNIDKMFYDDSCAIYAYRPVKELSPEQLDKVIAYARSETGAPYSVLEAIISVITPFGRGSRKQYCSRLIARAYASAGVKLVWRPNYCSPGGLQCSKKLVELHDVVVQVSEEEIAALEAGGDTTIGMREITNKLLDTIKEFAPSVRVLNDIDPLVRDNPSLDDNIAEAYQESGFLDFYKVELQRFPWRYDSTLMVQQYHMMGEHKDLLMGYCVETLDHELRGGFEHWKHNLVAYKQMQDRFPRKTFELMVNLYFNLCFYHERRIKTAQMLIDVYGPKS